MIKINLEEFKENFYLFRGNLRAFSKILNSLHLNILAKFSEIIVFEEDLCNTDESHQQFFNVITNIFLDLKSFYYYKTNETRRFDHFISKKYNEIEIHEMITRIISNLSKKQQFALAFLEENIIIDDLIQYINKIANYTADDFIKYTIENDGKKKGIVEIKKTFLSIGENTLNIFRNLLNDSNFKEPQYLTFLERVINYY